MLSATAYSQFSTKLHFFPLICTIDKKKEQCKPFFTIFPIYLNDLAHFNNKNKIVINEAHTKLFECKLLE